ncbi:MAG: carboxypeptidase-like regulatory domain-containing protein [Acidobacteriota bacterium]
MYSNLKLRLDATTAEFPGAKRQAKRSSVARLFTLLSVMLLAAASVSAQSLAGLAAINGTVRDSTGALLPEAEVVVSNVALGIDRKIIANGEGFFLAPSLPPASGYLVTVRKDGFSPNETRNIQLLVGTTVTLAIDMKLSQASGLHHHHR